MSIQEMGIAVFLVAILIAAAVILAPAVQRAREVDLPAVPDFPEPAIVQDARAAVEVAGVLEQAAIDTLGAEGHAAGRHGEAVLEIFSALKAGSCTMQVYVQDPDCDSNRARNGQFVDGQKGYAVCNLNGQLGLVPILYDALSGEWKAMTGFFAGQEYLDGVLQRDKCVNLLDLSRISIWISFQELLEEEP